MTRETRDIVAGAAAMAVLLLILGVSYGGGGQKARAVAGTYVVRATFNRIDGLDVGGEVRVGGIRVGSVEKQTLDANYQAVVSMRLKSGVNLPIDTSAAIHTDGLFGAKFVVLQPGGDEEFLKQGDEISYTQDAMIVGELLELIIARGRERLKKAGEEKSDGS